MTHKVGKFTSAGKWGATVLMVTMLAVASVSAEQITSEYTFDQPRIETVTIAGETFDRVVMNGVTNSSQAGEPALPIAPARIMLPPGAEVVDVQVEAYDRVLIGSGFFVEPAQQPKKLSDMNGEISAPVPNAVIYQSADRFPNKESETITIQTFRGYDILILKLHPVQYVPTTGEVYYCPRLTVTVTTTDDGEVSPMFRGFDTDEALVTAKCDNPKQLAEYPAALSAGTRSYKFLILTAATMVSAFQPLKDYHDGTGMPTEIRTITEVGSSDPSDVRDYIRTEYLNEGIEYVLIGGDDNLIPALNLWVESWSGGDIVTDMPGDIYFACLDGGYNSDGDGYNGEPADNPDLVAEVFVGRAPVGNSTEATRFVNKTIDYLQTSNSYLQNVLMCGEHLGFGGVAEYAGNAMDENVDGSSNSGYTTVGIPSADYSIDYLYDRDYSGNNWPVSQLTSRINSGLHIINHLGHGYNNYALKLYASQISSYLSNTKYFFLYSQACLAGHFDGTDCFAEYMTIKSNDGAFAVVMNAREGWGTENTTDGPSQRYNRQFWDAVYSSAEDKRQIGWANHDSKEDNLYRINQSCMRWCYYETTLFGDPTVAIKGQEGLTFEYPNGVPRSTVPGLPTTFEVIVSGANGGTPVPNTGVLHYSLNDGPWLNQTMTQLSANHYEATLPAMVCDDNLEFYVSADESYAGAKYDPSPSNPNKVAPSTGFLAVLEDNFETNKGWTVTGDVTEGLWERGIPEFSNRGDPPTDYDGSGACYVTYNYSGNSDVDNGTTWLESPTFDLAGIEGSISYARWYSNDYGANPEEDVFVVYISNNNGTDWVEVETVGPAGDEVSGGWFTNEFWASDFVTPTAQMKVRFEVSDLVNPSVVEAGVDAFAVVTYECVVDGDDDTDGVPNSIDNCMTTYNPGQADVDEDGIGDLCDDCPNDDQNDADNDGHCADADNCPNAYNPDQTDADDDTFGTACDCDDGNADLNPNTVWYEDSDSDTFGNPDVTMTQCEQPTGYVANSEDCDDTDGEINGLTVWYRDFDEDGYGTPAVTITQCDQPVGYSLDSTDCNDTNGDVNPATVWYEDVDGDNYGDPESGVTVCEQPAGYVLDNTDNCPANANPDQDDFDADGLGDLCDSFCCMGEMVGNIDCDSEDQVTMGDLTALIDHLFVSLDPVCCEGEADTDGGSGVTMGDLTVLIDHLFISLNPLPTCP